tara:strand:+ start:99 stop:311 length:213 start_codon:yes stop_codon:yes gene_type:complete
MYRVTYARDSLDTNPTVKEFDFHDEASDWLHEEVSRRVAFAVEHSPYTVSEEEYNQMEEVEYTLVKMEKI